MFSRRKQLKVRAILSPLEKRIMEGNVGKVMALSSCPELKEKS
jgi:hypothetical protein